MKWRVRSSASPHLMQVVCLPALRRQLSRSWDKRLKRRWCNKTAYERMGRCPWPHWDAATVRFSLILSKSFLKAVDFVVTVHYQTQIIRTTCKCWKGLIGAVQTNKPMNIEILSLKVHLFTVGRSSGSAKAEVGWCNRVPHQRLHPWEANYRPPLPSAQRPLLPRDLQTAQGTHERRCEELFFFNLPIEFLPLLCNNRF